MIITFRKKKFLLLFKELGSLPKDKPHMGYKSACLRFSAIFNDLRFSIWADCVRCHNIFCSSLCIQDSDEVIIFDFGSKTTWFKYASDSTGQLSMHPTVVPPPAKLVSGGADDRSDGIDIYQGCPVCCRMFQNRSLPIASLEHDNKTDALKTEHISSRRLTSAFSRLAMRHFPSCFDSAEITDSVMSLAAGLSPSGSSAVGMASSSTSCPSSDSNTNQTVLDHALELDESSQKSTAAPSVTGERIPESALDDNPSDPSNVEDSTVVDDVVSTYKFLIMHMLKRNPFFQARYIPFVVCEPTNCSHEMKVQLLQFLFVETKVPG